MNYILTLCLSGSMMEIIYFGVKYILGNRLSANWQFRMIKAVIVFFLLPLPWLKYIYVFIIDHLMYQRSVIEGMVHLYTDKSMIIYKSGKIIFNQALEKQYFILMLWMLITMSVMGGQCIRYLGNKRRLNKYQQLAKDEIDIDIIKQFKEKYSIRRKVKCVSQSGECSGSNMIFTTGIFSPTIICITEIEGWERRAILKHEMIHIKRWDILWRMLMLGVQIAYWYNPLVWLLANEFERTCEMSCDNWVLQGEGEEEKRKYGKLLLTMVIEEQQSKSYILALSKSGKQLRERIDNVMKGKKKCFGRVFSAVLVGGAILINSLTVFAYEDVQFTRVAEDNEEYLEDILSSDIAFVPGGKVEMMQYSLYENLIIETSVIYETQFIDMEGNIYPIYNEEADVYASCNHDYILGTLQNHIKQAEGNCTVILYNAKRCAKCADIQIGDEIRRINYQPCPH